jgi:hypothetical protein
MRAPWVVLAVLAIAEVALAWQSWDQARREHVVYVMTPMVDVVPGGAPLTGEEATALSASLRTQVDARDMQSAYAWLGSTLSLDDLLRGVELLDTSDHPLDPIQRERVRLVLTGAQAQHEEILTVQRDILADEAAIDADVAAVLALLPPDVAARVRGGRR